MLICDCRFLSRRSFIAPLQGGTRKPVAPSFCVFFCVCDREEASSSFSLQLLRSCHSSPF